eukprot:8442423-Lingulodinium_polyedra.AAC.1
MAVSWEAHVLRGTGADKAGHQVSIAYTCYRYTDGASWWRFDDMIETFHSKRAQLRVWSEALKERALLQRLCQELGLDLAQLYLPSSR